MKTIKSVRASSIFTPNTERGGAVRYVLYRRGATAFSVTPDGTVFRAKVEPDACGLGCFCGAYITPTSDLGFRLLLRAERIDSGSNPVD